MKTIITALLMLAVLVPSVQAAYIINPGQSHNCTEEGQIVSCGLCQGCNETCEPEDCSECSIDEEIKPGEDFEIDEGVCDVKVECQTCEETELEQRKYHIEIPIHKLGENDSLNFGIEIRDFTSALVDTKMFEFDTEDIASIRYKHTFTCPTKIFFEDINFQTCSAYFDDYMNESEPLMFQLATGTSECMGELLACKGNESANRELASHYKDLYTDVMTKNDVAEKKMKEYNATMHDMEDKITGEVVADTRGEVLMWQSTSFMFGLILAGVVFFGFIYSRPEGGGLR